MATNVFRLLMDRILKVDVNKIIDHSIASNEHEISDLNREQLNKGLTANGRDLGEYRNFGYKGRLRPVDLRDTGAFQEKIFAVPFQDKLELIGTDEKTDKLQDKYGDDIIGLSDEALDHTKELIKEDMILDVRNAILR